jgi:hypothetical protein
MPIRLQLVLLICSSLLFLPISYIPLNELGLPPFLEVGSIVQYKQEFSVGEIHELRWEIISIEGKLVEIEIRSHGLVFNTTTESFGIIPGGGTLIIDKDTWEIQEAHHTNGTQIYGYPINEKIPFWISIETNESTPINTMYETNEYPTLTDPIEFDSLSTPRICWKTENVYSVGNQMNRYYDFQTGIVLMIETQRTIFSENISVLETFNATNIDALIENVNHLDLKLVYTILLIALPVVILMFTIFYLQKRKQH